MSQSVGYLYLVDKQKRLMFTKVRVSDRRIVSNILLIYSIMLLVYFLLRNTFTVPIIFVVFIVLVLEVCRYIYAYYEKNIVDYI